jgi:S-adenosylmethionine synthetase
MTGDGVVVAVAWCWWGKSTNITFARLYTHPSLPQVDRSAAYAARWVAKSLVKAGLCKRCLVQVSYAIGIAEPISLYVDDYGTGTKTKPELLEIIKNNFDLRPGVIVRELDLKKPIFYKTAKYGHFGREEFTWEQPKELKF